MLQTFFFKLFNPVRTLIWINTSWILTELALFPHFFCFDYLLTKWGLHFNLCINKRLISNQGKLVLHRFSCFCNFPQGCHDTSGTGGEHLGPSQSRSLTDAFMSCFCYRRCHCRMWERRSVFVRRSRCRSLEWWRTWAALFVLHARLMIHSARSGSIVGGSGAFGLRRNAGQF